MKRTIFYLVLILAAFQVLSIQLKAQDVTTVEAKSSKISDNLDLEAVASILGEAKDLEDFEKKLNNPSLKINNLDLNEDGEVDYLRVLESSEGNTHVIVIQAVLGKDMYQDVATVDVEKDDSGETVCQVVGNVNIYGPDYIIQPVYVHRPVLFVWFWGPYYRPWRSPFHWGYYPHWYHPWHPLPPYRYHSHVRVNININNTYRHTHVRYSKNSATLSRKVSRNDFARNHPNKVHKAGSNKTRLKNNPNKRTDVKTKTKPAKVKSNAKTQTKQPQVKKSTGKRAAPKNTYNRNTKTGKTKSQQLNKQRTNRTRTGIQRNRSRAGSVRKR